MGKQNFEKISKTWFAMTFYRKVRFFANAACLVHIVQMYEILLNTTSAGMHSTSLNRFPNQCRCFEKNSKTKN